jgi:hypothetical protein
MVRKHSQSSSRVDYHFDQKRRSYDNLDDAPARVVPDDSELRQRAKRAVRREDELIWAHYRDPETYLTQVEARDRAQRTDYPDRYQIVQSSVSRLVGELDKRALTEPLQTLKMRRPEGEAIECGLLPEALVDDYLGSRYGGDVLDELRETVARFIVDRDALHRFAQGYESTPTPLWARDRFPDLDPDVGRKALLRNSDLPEGEVHQPTAELEAEPGGLAHD